VPIPGDGDVVGVGLGVGVGAGSRAGALLTATLTDAVLALPAASVARTAIVCVPSATLVELHAYVHAVVPFASTYPPPSTDTSIRATDALSDAVPTTETEPDTAAPSAGVVMTTLGFVVSVQRFPHRGAAFAVAGKTTKIRTIAGRNLRISSRSPHQDEREGPGEEGSARVHRWPQAVPFLFPFRRIERSTARLVTGLAVRFALLMKIGAIASTFRNVGVHA
jgi:hypothetical protein